MRRVIALALVALVTGCASTPPEDDPVQMKLKDLDDRLTRVERILSNQAEMAQHQDEVQAVRELRGRVDELENSSQAMRKQQRDLYNDLDKRLNAMGAGGNGAGGNSVPPSAQNNATAGAGAGGAGAGGAPQGASSVEQAVYNQ